MSRFLVSVQGVACAVLLLMAIAVGLPHSTGQEQANEPADDPRKIKLIAFDAGDEYWFESKAVPGRNPKLTLRPGEQVELTLESRASTQHNVRLGEPINRALPLLEPGRQDTMRFTTPAGAQNETSYWCEPHRSLGMQGTLAFGEPSEINIKLPGPSAAGALAAVALLLGFARRSSSAP